MKFKPYHLSIGVIFTKAGICFTDEGAFLPDELHRIMIAYKNWYTEECRKD